MKWIYISPSNHQGFTLIELLLIIAIVAILGAAATPFLSRFVLQTNFDSVERKVISTIRKAQAYALDGKNGAVWGVCTSGNNLRLYAGSCSSPTISENFSIPSTVSISGFSDTTFTTRGEPSNPLSITISTSLDSSSIQVNSTGGLSIQ